MRREEKTVSGALAPLAESELVELDGVEHARQALVPSARSRFAPVGLLAVVEGEGHPRSPWSTVLISFSARLRERAVQLSCLDVE